MTNTTGTLAPDARYAEYLEAGTLHLQVCEDCGRQVFFPRVLCPVCGSLALRWEPATSGVVHSTTVVRRRPDRGGDYNVALVELDGGARMMTRVTGAEPAEVRIGQAVEAYVRPGEDGDDAPLVLFRPRAEGGA